MCFACFKPNYLLWLLCYHEKAELCGSSDAQPVYICVTLKDLSSVFVPVSRCICRIIRLDISCLFCQRGNWFLGIAECACACGRTHSYAFCVEIDSPEHCFAIHLSALNTPNPTYRRTPREKSAAHTGSARELPTWWMRRACQPLPSLPGPAGVKTDHWFPPPPRLPLSAFIRLWICEAHELQQMAWTANHSSFMNEQVQRKV